MCFYFSERLMLRCGCASVSVEREGLLAELLHPNLQRVSLHGQGNTRVHHHAVMSSNTMASDVHCMAEQLEAIGD